jgi:hypothetical protein
MFTDPLSDLDLYWAGYIQADGGLYSKVGQEYRPGLFRKTGGTLVFGQVLREPVEALLAYVQGEGQVSHKIYDTNYKVGAEVYSMSSSKPYQALKALGIKDKCRADLYLSLHFWRGLLDGDGTVSTQPSPIVCWSGNQHDMERCANWVEGLGLRRYKVSQARSIYRVGINGEPAAYLLKLLYLGHYSAHPGKRERAQEAMTWRVQHPRQSRLTPEQRTWLLS